MKDWGWDERELVRRCKEGSEAGYAELVRQHRPRLFTLAYRLTNDPGTAEDVVQEAFLAAFRAIERFEPKPSVAAWLNTITIRLAGKAAARRRERATTSLSTAGDGDGDGVLGLVEFAPIDPTQDPHAAAEASELRAIISAAIVALPFNMRAAVVLRHVLGLDYADAARAMGVPLNTYKSHLLRGTRELRVHLAGLIESRPTHDRVVKGVRSPEIAAAAIRQDASERHERVGFELPAVTREEAAPH